MVSGARRRRSESREGWPAFEEPLIDGDAQTAITGDVAVLNEISPTRLKKKGW